MTTFKVLSHACMLVKTRTSSVIIDPWLIGLCYWRSWANYPPASYSEQEISDVDAVVISHVHWDHWHGPTLKKFFKNKRIITSKEPNCRSVKDLRSIGVKQIEQLGHKGTVTVGDIDITFFQFGLFLQDSAIIIRTPDTVLLNANDAKMTGPSLSHLTKLYGPFDFALRSHSSANPRICFSTLDDPDQQVDDREHYFRSFKLFMDVVKPRYAIPFASNHTHCNFDCGDYAEYVSNPFELLKYLERDSSDWTFVPMLPGSSWSSTENFDLRGQDYFLRKDIKHPEVVRALSPIIEKYRVIESKITLSENFSPFLLKFYKTAVPVFFRRKITFAVTKAGIINEVYEVNRSHIKYTKVTEKTDLSAYSRVIFIPNVILKDAVLKNMFHHAGISKRVKYVAQTKQQMKTLKKIVFFLELYELTGPYRLKFAIKLLGSYANKLPELLTYFKAIRLKIKTRDPLYLIEERLFEL